MDIIVLNSLKREAMAQIIDMTGVTCCKKNDCMTVAAAWNSLQLPGFIIEEGPNPAYAPGRCAGVQRLIPDPLALKTPQRRLRRRRHGSGGRRPGEATKGVRTETVTVRERFPGIKDAVKTVILLGGSEPIC